MAPYIFIKGHKHGERNKTGLAYMIRDVADALAQQNIEVEVLTQSVFTKEQKIDSWLLLKKTWIDVILNFKWSYFKRALRLLRKWEYPLSRKLRIILYFITAGYAEKLIKTHKPDIVHIHCLDTYTVPFLYACARTNCRLVLTLHGLNSFDLSTNASAFERELERRFLQYNTDTKITVVSTGVKLRIENWLQKQCPNILTVQNAYKREECSRKKEKKGVHRVLLCVGNLIKRKNQMQVLLAYNKLDVSLKAVTDLVFLGEGELMEEMLAYIKENSLDNVRMMGSVPRDTMDMYYENADALLVASKDEGFGLPIIEAYSYGVPVVTFGDLDAIPDLYNENCMVLVHERTDEAFSEGIKIALSRDWDRDYIKSYARNFSTEEMARKYKTVFNAVHDNNLSASKIDQICYS